MVNDIEIRFDQEAYDEMIEIFPATDEFTELLFDSGLVDARVERWAGVLDQGASGVVNSATIRSDADVLLNYTEPTL